MSNGLGLAIVQGIEARVLRKARVVGLVTSRAPAPTQRQRAGRSERSQCTRAAWVWKVGLQRVHGTTHELVQAYVDDELRKVARDVYVSWQGSRYSVPWRYAGRKVCLRERDEAVEVHYGRERVATHGAALRKHQVVTQAEHYGGIPLGVRSPDSKTLVRLRECAPVVENRSLAVYESIAGGAR